MTSASHLGAVHHRERLDEQEAFFYKWEKDSEGGGGKGQLA